MGRVVAGLVVGVLIDEDGAHVGVQKHLVLAAFQRPHVDVNAVDFTHTVKKRIQNAYGLGQVVHIGVGQLPADQKYAFVTLPNELQRGLPHLRRGHVLAFHKPVVPPVGAIQTLTAAMVGQVQRR